MISWTEGKILAPESSNEAASSATIWTRGIKSWTANEERTTVEWHAGGDEAHCLANPVVPRRSVREVVIKHLFKEDQHPKVKTNGQVYRTTEE